MTKNDYGDYIYGRAALRLNEPWITPEALGALKLMFFGGKLNNSKICDGFRMNIFEWGAGGSTVWWGKNTSGNVYSVEQGREWVARVMEQIEKHELDNTKVFYIPMDEGKAINEPGAYDDYADALKLVPEDVELHLIFVDGERRCRVQCIKNAMERLIPGGVLLVDNSNWPDIQPGIVLLKNWMRLDFDAPANSHIPNGWRTSFYFKPENDLHEATLDLLETLEPHAERIGKEMREKYDDLDFED